MGKTSFVSMDIQSLIVFLFLLVFMYYTTHRSSYCFEGNVKLSNFYLLTCVLVYSAFMGMRVGLGTDTMGYRQHFDLYQIKPSIITSRFEYGYCFVLWVVSHLGLGKEVFMGVISFIQLFFIFKIFEDKREILPYLVIVFIISTEFVNFNGGIRQITAMCIFFYSIKFIVERNLFKFLLCVALAWSFHKSALIVIIFYPLLNKNTNLFENVKLQILLLFICILLSRTSIIASIIGYLDMVISILGYSGYLERTDEIYRSDIQFGLGFLVTIVIHFIIVFNSSKVKEYFNDEWINTAYKLFFIGTLIYYILISSHMVGRLNYYMHGLYFVFGALSLMYFKRTENQTFMIALSLLYVLNFSHMIISPSSYSVYYFTWQENEYFQKYGYEITEWTN